MTKPFSSNLGLKLRFFSWPTALIGIVAIRAVLSIAVKPGSFLVSYSGISYFLLLLLATGFAIRNGIRRRTQQYRAIRPYAAPWRGIPKRYTPWTQCRYHQLASAR